MYLTFYNLAERPFPEKIAPERLWLTENAKEALTTFRDSIYKNKGILLLTGDIGTGKTSFINKLTGSFPEDIILGSVTNFDFDQLEFLQVIADAFLLPITVGSQGEFLAHFTGFLADAVAAGKKILLIIDEAQNLSADLLPIIEMLADTKVNGQQPLNIFLVGSNEFNTILLQPQNSALRERIAVNFNLAPLTRQDTENYIKHHLKCAHGDANIFSPEAIDAIFTFANGSPRLVNYICDLALLNGFSQGAKIISGKIISDCVEYFVPPNDKDWECLFPTRQPSKNSRKQDAGPQQQQKHLKLLTPRYGFLVLLILVLIGTGQAYRLFRNLKPPISKTEKAAHLPPASAVSPIEKSSTMPRKPEQTSVAREDPQPEENLSPDVTVSMFNGTGSALEAVSSGNLRPHPSKLEKKSPPNVTASQFNDIGSALEVISTGNLLSHPSMDADIITSVPQGETVIAVKKINNWYLVQLHDGVGGWMRGTLLGSVTKQEGKEVASSMAQMSPPTETVPIPTEVQAATEERRDDHKSAVQTASQPVATKRASQVSSPEKAMKSKSEPIQTAAAVPSEAGRVQEDGLTTAAPAQPQPAAHIPPAEPERPEKPSTPAAAQIPTATAQGMTEPEKTAPAPTKKEQASKTAELSDTASSQSIAQLPKAETPPPAREKTAGGKVQKGESKPDIVKTDNPEAVAWSRKSFESGSMKLYSQAITEATIAITLDPGLVSSYINRAWAFCEIGQYEKAIADSFTALRLAPDSALAYNNMGVAFQRIGDLRKAQTNYEQGCRRNLELACNNLDLVKAKLTISGLMADSRAAGKRENWNKALQIIGKILVRDPANQQALALQSEITVKKEHWILAEVLTKQSFTLVSQGKYDAAIKAATKAISLHSGLINPYINRCWAYSETGQYIKAIQDCNTALALDSENALALNNMGLAYQKLGNGVKAREYYIKACKKKLAVACENLGKIVSGH